MAIPDLLLGSQVSNYFGDNAENVAIAIERVISYLGGTTISFLLARYRKKHLPLPRIKFIDDTLDKIFGENTRDDKIADCDNDDD